MTEPVSVPARQRSPGHTLRLDAATTAAALAARGCWLGTPSSEMSPSDCLCLIITGLILPGLTLEATNISLPGSTTENIHVLTPAPDTVHPELQPTPQTSTLQADDATPNQMETQTQQPTGMDVLLTTDLGADESRTQVVSLVSLHGSLLLALIFWPFSLLIPSEAPHPPRHKVPHPPRHRVPHLPRRGVPHSPRREPQAKTSGGTPSSNRMVRVRTTPSLMTRTPSGNGGCWWQPCSSSQASSSSPVANVGSCPDYAGITAEPTE
ncbi:FXYD domain-containing ion transport regulator 5 isoform X2 [Sus scrofa]|uniref:FXYD domain-containing ion transport regulator 5 isoform X2 n=1 Tax=Sus scrofa TaxID=9823 RepID=UPI000A2B794B|nr:FXYD domain-containing ion transport regulator 5 isoform X2 [Sus scrofa]